ncbi:MAG: selenide, water dikinase SelD [Rhodobacteraceae bacterium]|nr:selenide, water dikinase SelD [Paracoccaceae bacterium]MAY44444.1 selenide, water dikinase SelD [Paracoccaceae bacterium]
MDHAPLPLTRDIVLVGGGHTHALVLRMWGMSPLPGARLTLINPGPTAPYSGMLPGHVAGHYSRDDLDIDLVRLARFAGARLILGAATALDPAAREVHVPGRPPVGYDLCSVDVGITSAMPTLPGFADHAIPAKPLGAFAAAWAAYLDRSGPADVAVIGAGVAGVELALAMAHALSVRGRPHTVTLVDRDKALSALRPASARRIRTVLDQAGVVLREHTPITAVTPEGVQLGDEILPATFITGAAGARPYDWPAASGLDTTDGYLTIAPTLQTSDPDIFATGDCAHMGFAPRPKAGVYAVRQAPILFHNLRARAMDRPLRAYRPQDDYLKLISLGGKSALGERFGRPLMGPLMWRWKDRIDTRFMEKFRDLPVMPAPKLPRDHTSGMIEAVGDKPLCGGCGAKVGRAGLSGVIAAAPADRPDIEMLPGDDAAVLKVADHRLVLTTDHLRAMVEDPVTMTRITAVHALGDIWAMGGTPKTALVSLILPRLSPTLQQRTLAEIMTTARAEMRAAGAEIVGGHTSVGAELTIGFSVTGEIPDRPVTLAGGRAGDVLILTKPLGSGVVMAAEMAGRARGADVAQALMWMQQGQGRASEILREAHAMTDVTGFGLAGHLEGICTASGMGAELAFDAIPLMEGAVQLAEQGVRSTLFLENRALAVTLPMGGAADLLFDPQTGGGLLAAVAPDRADMLIEELKAAGYRAASVGRLMDGPPVIRLVP